MTYTREMAQKLLDEMPDEKVEAFITLFADENMLARMECEDMIAHPEKYKWYHSAEEVRKAILG